MQAGKEDMNWREDKAFMQFLEVEFGPVVVSEDPLLRSMAMRIGREVLPRLYRAFYAGKMSEGGGDLETFAKLYRDQAENG